MSVRSPFMSPFCGRLWGQVCGCQCGEVCGCDKPPKDVSFLGARFFWQRPGPQAMKGPE